MKIIEHHKRYMVQRFDSGWGDYISYRWLWHAKRVARYRESLGIMRYRVVDTKS